MNLVASLQGRPMEVVRDEWDAAAARGVLEVFLVESPRVEPLALVKSAVFSLQTVARIALPQPGAGLPDSAAVRHQPVGLRAS